MDRTDSPGIGQGRRGYIPALRRIYTPSAKTVGREYIPADHLPGRARADRTDHPGIGRGRRGYIPALRRICTPSAKTVGREYIPAEYLPGPPRANRQDRFRSVRGSGGLESLPYGDIRTCRGRFPTVPQRCLVHRCPFFRTAVNIRGIGRLGKPSLQRMPAPSVTPVGRGLASAAVFRDRTGRTGRTTPASDVVGGDISPPYEGSVHLPLKP